VRRFWRGDEGMMSQFASRICGSSDVYGGSGKGPECSINFVTCHDGFTLNDLVTYAHKHNDANGENGRDGSSENFSANYGVEGPSDDPAIEAVRIRQIKNFLLTVAISRGVPMLLGGDEFRRSQGGNNNAYCQDNEVSWVDWSLPARHSEVFQFAQGMLAFRRAHPVLSQESFYSAEDVLWFNASGKSPDWFNPRQRCLACLIRSQDAADLFLMFNAGTEAVAFVVPPLPSPGTWRIAADTAQPVQQDFYRPGDETELLNPASYTVQSRSSAILVSR
jgi:glycogen operon protein